MTSDRYLRLSVADTGVGMDAATLLVVSGYAEIDESAPDLKRLVKPFQCDKLSAALHDRGVARKTY